MHSAILTERLYGSIQYLDGQYVGATKSVTVTCPGSTITGVCGSVWMSSGIGTHRFYAARTSSGIEQVALTSQNITAITVSVSDNVVTISYSSPFSASDSKITYRIAYI